MTRCFVDKFYIFKTRKLKKLKTTKIVSRKLTGLQLFFAIVGRYLQCQFLFLNGVDIQLILEYKNSFVKCHPVFPKNSLKKILGHIAYHFNLNWIFASRRRREEGRIIPKYKKGYGRHSYRKKSPKS